MNTPADAAVKLHRYLVGRHWSDRGLIGPDPGIRWNYRIGRFLKSYLGGSLWTDDLYYLQAQGYWTLDNWSLFARCGDTACREIATGCCETMLARQRRDGAWEYPNREWRGRISETEGTWGSLGLLEGYRRTGNRRFLEGALRWHEFLTTAIGFQRHGDALAVNDFAGREGSPVPNASALALRFLAELADATGDDAYRRRCPGLLRFLETVQSPSGEFPYTVLNRFRQGRPHFQCFQYNAFQCLDLMRYFALVNEKLPPWIDHFLNFLRTGVAPDGHAYYQCGNRRRTVNYHTAVLAAALHSAGRLGFPGCREPADRACRCLLAQQRPDGGFPYSRGDYRFLRDQRSYPRYLAMILLHLLMLSDAGQCEPARSAAPHVQAR
jgi:hypothetical protein